MENYVNLKNFLELLAMSYLRKTLLIQYVKK